ncbi:hypothetical protein EXIGLDRAFT_782097 [Exidia glandulosa HHB12029]|uniref:Uncharacterized protein n=1 Tax=Exidia glandulosa HHB12029 TaxID=1314781 RepID=A0A165Z5N7_EXIGL|nr:hypothetical protein EXIGLDRAFT_782097 [Exidia glandulosa HHB12029]
MLGYQSMACAPACRHLSHEEMRVRAYDTGWGPPKRAPTGAFASPGVWTAKLDIPLTTLTWRPSSNAGFFILPSHIPPPTAFTHAHCDTLIKAERACRTQEESLRRLAQGACDLLNGALRDTEAKYARVQLDVAAEKMRADRLERQVSDLKDAEVAHRKELDDARRECAAALSDAQDLRAMYTAQSEGMADLRKGRQTVDLERNTLSARVVALEAAADDAQTRYRELSVAHSALQLACVDKEQKHAALKRRTAVMNDLVIILVSVLVLVLCRSA